MHLELIEYVKHKKNKSLAEKVKQLRLSADIFRSTNKWIGALSITIVFSGILLLNIYYLNVANWLMMTVTAIVSVSIFVLIRKVQSQPRTLINELSENGKICEKIATLIRKEEAKTLLD